MSGDLLYRCVKCKICIAVATSGTLHASVTCLQQYAGERSPRREARLQSVTFDGKKQAKTKPG